MLFRPLSLPLLLILCCLFIPPPSSFQRKLESRRRGRDGKQIAVSPCLPQYRLCCHSRSRGNVLNKPLDSGFRRNDDEEIRHGPLTFKVILNSVIPAPFGSLLSLSFHPRRHSSESWNPGRRGQDAKQIAISPCPPAKGRRSSADMSIKPARIYLSLRNPPKLSAIVPAPCRFT